MTQIKGKIRYTNVCMTSTVQIIQSFHVQWTLVKAMKVNLQIKKKLLVNSYQNISYSVSKRDISTWNAYRKNHNQTVCSVSAWAHEVLVQLLCKSASDSHCTHTASHLNSVIEANYQIMHQLNTNVSLVTKHLNSKSDICMTLMYKLLQQIVCRSQKHLRRLWPSPWS